MKRHRDVAEAPVQRAIAYWEAWLSGITPEDVRAIGIALVERAKAGDITAARLVLDRLLGSPSVAEWDSRVTMTERTRLDELFQFP